MKYDRIAIDTNRLTDLFRGDATVVQIVASIPVLYIPFVVLGEYEFGLAAGSKKSLNRRNLAALRARERVNVLWATERTVEIYGGIAADLKRRGTPIPQNDIWIAALCLQTGMPLFTQDVHFKQVPGLTTL